MDLGNEYNDYRKKMYEQFERRKEEVKARKLERAYEKRLRLRRQTETAISKQREKTERATAKTLLAKKAYELHQKKMNEAHFNKAEKRLGLNKVMKVPGMSRIPLRIKEGGYATLMKETVLGGVQGQHEGFTYKKEMPKKIMSMRSDLF